MVEISYSYNKKHFGISLLGHADYAESGKDIVCAGASLLVCEIMILTARAKEKGEISNLKQNVDSGDVCISFDFEKHKSKNQNVVELVLELLQSLEEQYPKNIHLEEIKHGNICA